MIEHTLTLYGAEAGAGKPRPAMVGPLLTMLEPTVRDNLRLAFFSSSRIKGRPYKPLQKAWEIRLAGMRGGPDDSTELIFELPLLGEAAPQFFEQMELWDDAPKPEETALDILGYTLSDIASGREASNRFDLPLLGRFHSLNRILKKGLSRVTFGGHCLSNGRAVPPIEQPFVDMVDRMMNDTPATRRIRVHGTLDMVRCSDRVFEVVTLDGGRLRAAWIPTNLAPLREYLNHQVLIEGEVMFRPAGTALRVDADAIRPAQAGDDFFSKLPQPAMNTAHTLKKAPVGVITRNGFESFAGAWPGDESIGELLETLAELGR